MRVLDSLIKDREKKKKKARELEDSEEEEETLTYKERGRQVPMGDGPEALTARTFEGINSRKDIFDRTAVFHTER